MNPTKVWCAFESRPGYAITFSITVFDMGPTWRNSIFPADLNAPTRCQSSIIVKFTLNESRVKPSPALFLKAPQKLLRHVLFGSEGNGLEIRETKKRREIVHKTTKRISAKYRIINAAEYVK